MALTKLQLQPGFNQENTRYSSEGRWWDGDKVRFRFGTPQTIGGWLKFSDFQFLGTCRSLLAWMSLGGTKYLGVGTHLKFYLNSGGFYYDITPIRSTVTLTNPFTATAGSTTLLVDDVAHGANDGDFVTFSGATGLGGAVTANVLNAEHQISVINADSYTITLPTAANATDAAASPGGGTVSAAYQVNTGPEYVTPLEGWGAGGWGFGPWGFGLPSTVSLGLWSQSNFGERLLFNPRGGPLYLSDPATNGPDARGTLVSAETGASDVPTAVNQILVTDQSRFVLAFGCNELGSTTIDPMLVRWSAQESYVDWTPSATNQAGGIRLTVGSEIVARIQSRQEVLVWTNSALYSMQYLGPPFVWGQQLVANNVTILGPNAVALVGGTAYWMGNGQFYIYDGQARPMRCDLLSKVFGELNKEQQLQVCAGTNESFNEVWWHYPSGSSLTNDRYVIYNYAEDVWYSGTMTRTAWIDRGLFDYPIAATRNSTNTLVQHEIGCCNGEFDELVPLDAYVESAEFDIGDGDNFAFIWRVLPDITFRNSIADNPQATLTLYPMRNPGAGFGTSVGGEQDGNVLRSVSVPVEQFTNQLNIRVRGRQMVMRVESNQLGVAWKLGTPLIDIKPDGKR